LEKEDGRQEERESGTKEKRGGIVEQRKKTERGEQRRIGKRKKSYEREREGGE
jgi:hypothetical protein